MQYYLDKLNADWIIREKHFKTKKSVTIRSEHKSAVLYNRLAILKESSEKNLNVKKFFETLTWLKRYDILKIIKILKIVTKWRKIRNSQLKNFSTS